MKHEHFPFLLNSFLSSNNSLKLGGNINHFFYISLLLIPPPRILCQYRGKLDKWGGRVKHEHFPFLLNSFLFSNNSLKSGGNKNQIFFLSPFCLFPPPPFYVIPFSYLISFLGPS